MDGTARPDAVGTMIEQGTCGAIAADPALAAQVKGRTLPYRAQGKGAERAELHRWTACRNHGTHGHAELASSDTTDSAAAHDAHDWTEYGAHGSRLLSGVEMRIADLDDYQYNGRFRIRGVRAVGWTHRQTTGLSSTGSCSPGLPGRERQDVWRPRRGDGDPPMRREEVLRALARLKSRAASACVDAEQQHLVSAALPPFGRTTVGEARVLFEHRRGLLVKGGAHFQGLDELLSELATRGSDEPLTLAGFTGATESYVAFLSADGEAIGCVRIETTTQGLTP